MKGTLTQPETPGSLKEADLRDAIERAGGGRAVYDRMLAFQRASMRMDADHKDLLEKYPRSWVAVGADGLVTRLEVSTNPDGSPAHREAIEFLVKEMARMEMDSSAYVLEFLNPDPETWIL